MQELERLRHYAGLIGAGLGEKRWREAFPGVPEWECEDDFDLDRVFLSALPGGVELLFAPCAPDARLMAIFLHPAALPETGALSRDRVGVALDWSFPFFRRRLGPSLASGGGEPDPTLGELPPWARHVFEPGVDLHVLIESGRLMRVTLLRADYTDSAAPSPI